MRTTLEPEDIQVIVSAVIEGLKPFMSSKSASRLDDTAFDVPELCDHLHVSAKWVYKRTHLKEIPHYKVEGVLLFKKNEIEKWMAAYKVPAMNQMTGNLRYIK